MIDAPGCRIGRTKGDHSPKVGTGLCGAAQSASCSRGATAAHGAASRPPPAALGAPPAGSYGGAERALAATSGVAGARAGTRLAAPVVAPLSL